MIYGWDDAGRLASASKDFNPATTFTYDGDGVRTSKTSGGQTTTYVNDARGLAQVLQETKGATTVSYVPGVGQYDPSKPAGAPQWGYTLSDSQNSRLLVDGAGTLGHRWEWKPFGETRADVGSTSSPFTFGGEQKDDETGLINLRARYYNPAIGRFLSRDSLPGIMTLPQSWNRYSYVENDPINHLDPSGHKKKKIKWPGGQDPDDDSHQKKKAKKCKNPGQYTGSCKGGPPNPAYAADGEAQHEAKKAGQAAAAGNLAAAAAHLQAAAHFASIAGTSAAATATAQAYASILAAKQSIQAARPIDSGKGILSDTSGDADNLMLRGPITPACSLQGDPLLCAGGVGASVGTWLWDSVRGVMVWVDWTDSGGAVEAAPPESDPSQIYHRRNTVASQTDATLDLIVASSEIWGRPPTEGGITSPFPSVQAFVGPLPEGQAGVEFETSEKPDRSRGGGYWVYWDEKKPHRLRKEDHIGPYVVLPVRIRRVVYEDPAKNP